MRELSGRLYSALSFNIALVAAGAAALDGAGGGVARATGAGCRGAGARDESSPRQAQSLSAAPRHARVGQGQVGQAGRRARGHVRRRGK